MRHSLSAIVFATTITCFYITHVTGCKVLIIIIMIINYRVFKVNSYFTLAALLFVSLHILYFPMLSSIALQYTSEVVLVLVHAVGIASLSLHN